MLPFFYASTEFVSLIDLLSFQKYSDRVLIGVIFLLTIFIYFKSLDNGFVKDWDDDIYITSNPDIIPSPNNSLVKNAFTKFSNGHYHPVTTISYGIEYRLFGAEAKPYHAFNLIFHLITVLLVFVFVKILINEKSVAFFTAILFAVHPMHVESVSWISDRKDILCSLFFVSGMCTYMIYLNKRIKRYFWYTFLLFIMALLSKAMAITLPVVLLLLDYFKGRGISRKVILEKVPLFILSLVFGYISVMAQKSNDALGDITALGFVDRFAFSGYSLVMYLVHLFCFSDISAFYNYPVLENGEYPLVYYILPFALLVLCFVLFKLKEYRKLVVFSFGFFLVTIALVLQIVPAGNVIMADRYTYLPYLGLFFFIAYLSDRMIKRHLKYANVIYGLLFVFILTCSFFAFNRTKVWHDSMSLWNDTLKKNPQAALPYSNRAALYIASGQPQLALADLNKALELRPDYITAHYNRAVVYMRLERFNEAISDFTFVSQRKSRDVISVLMQRGDAYARTKNYLSAIDDFSNALKLNPNFTQAYYNRGLCFYSSNQYDLAINDFNTATQQNPNFTQAYYMRGLSFYKTGNYAMAYENIMTSSKMGYRVNPKVLNEIELKLKH